MPPDRQRPPAEPRGVTITGKAITGHCSKIGVDRPTIEALVDLAIGSGAMVALVSARLVVVPDTALIEAEANGEPYVGTTLLRRDDGRTAALYRLPAVRQ